MTVQRSENQWLWYFVSKHGPKKKNGSLLVVPLPDEVRRSHRYSMHVKCLSQQFKRVTKDFFCSIISLLLSHIKLQTVWLSSCGERVASYRNLADQSHQREEESPWVGGNYSVPMHPDLAVVPTHTSSGRIGVKEAGLPWWLSWYRTRLQCRRTWFNSWVGKIC